MMATDCWLRVAAGFWLLRLNCWIYVVEGRNSCYIGRQSLYFYWMPLSNVCRTQEGVLRSQIGSRPKNVLKWLKCPTVFVVEGPNSWYIGNQSLYSYWMPLSNVCRAQEGVSRSQRGSLVKKMARSGQIMSKNTQSIMFWSDRRPGSCYMGNPTLYFH